MNLAIVTFAFAVAIDAFLFQNPGVNGGFLGAPVKVPNAINPIQRPPSAAARVQRWFGILCLTVVVLIAGTVVNLRRSATGRRLLATRRTNGRPPPLVSTWRQPSALPSQSRRSSPASAVALVSIEISRADATYFGDVQSLTFFAFAYLGGIA